MNTPDKPLLRNTPIHDGAMSIFGVETQRCEKSIIIVVPGDEDEDHRFMVISLDYARLMAKTLLSEVEETEAGNRWDHAGKTFDRPN